MSLRYERLRLSEFLDISGDEQSFHNPAECGAQDFKDDDLEHFDNLDNFLSCPCRWGARFHPLCSLRVVRGD